MSGHTPGPWFAHPKWRRVCAHGDTSFSVVESNRLADRTPPHDEDLANLDLIAAAPELFGAIVGLLNMYVALANSGDAGNWNPELEPQVIAARAAIARATGGDA